MCKFVDSTPFPTLVEHIDKLTLYGKYKFVLCIYDFTCISLIHLSEIAEQKDLSSYTLALPLAIKSSSSSSAL